MHVKLWSFYLQVCQNLISASVNNDWRSLHEAVGSLHLPMSPCAQVTNSVLENFDYFTTT